MIILKMYEGKWRIEIDSEGFEFKDYKSFKETLEKLIKIKEVNGRIKDENL